jgi:4-hydroxymandelate oxidase
VIEAVGDGCEVYLDGGIRGSAVLTAIALGPRAVLVGRPILRSYVVGGEQER